MIDISVPITSGMVTWPGDPEVSVELFFAGSIEKGAQVNLSRFSMGAHAGTHIDAPLHYIRGGKGIDWIPFEAVIGRARVIGIQDRVSIKLEELEKHDIRKGERVLFKTFNSLLWGKDKFQGDFVYLGTAAAEYLAARKVLAVGIDYLSVGGYGKNEQEVHRTLLEAGVWIIEGLNLSAVQPGNYELICLPLKLEGAEAAPARAALRPA
ncbi:MAG: cyclase family protein [Nitrospiraceae bacterium]|nr:cyclase family protein [Nitrospiraceae bacterium]